MAASPPPRVLAAFGAVGLPTPLAGGQRPVWRAGDLVFKPADLPADAVAWQADVIGAITPAARVRVAPPVAAASGEWVVEDWTVWEFVAGTSATGEWDAIADAGVRLHAALADQPRPALLDRRDDPWSRADRLTWDLSASAPHPILASAFERRRPVQLSEQLVHGDLTGNVLVEPGEPPAVIDFAPYWHPPAWATAVIAADAMLFAAAGPRSVEFVADHHRIDQRTAQQLLLRTLLFRSVTTLLAEGPDVAKALLTSAADLARALTTS